MTQYYIVRIGTNDRVPISTNRKVPLIVDEWLFDPEVSIMDGYLKSILSSPVYEKISVDEYRKKYSTYTDEMTYQIDKLKLLEFLWSELYAVQHHDREDSETVDCMTLEYEFVCLINKIIQGDFDVLD